jgi:hypothetical protein
MGDSQSQKAGDHSTQVQAAGNVSITVGLSYADFKLAMAEERERIVEQVWERAQEMLREAGVQPGPVALKTLIPLLQAASMEEDRFLQDRWAALLANAATLGHCSDIRASFVAILADLSSRDVLLLEACYDFAVTEMASRNKQDVTEVGLGHPGTLLRRVAPLAEQDIIPNLSYSSVDNIRRLGLIDSYSRFKDAYHFTSLGVEFIEACRPLPKVDA